MAQNIYAWLDNGLPRLRIIDAETGRVNVSWDYQAEPPERPGQRQEIQRLFRQLLLLTCQQEFENVRCYGLQSFELTDMGSKPGISYR